MFVASGGVAVAQQGDRPGGKSLYEKTKFKDEDCAILKEGTAPLNRLTRMQGGLAVANLNLTYLGKPLHQLNADDFRILPELLIQCANIDAALAKFQAERLKTLIEDARTSYDSGLAWFEDVKTEVAKMTGSAVDIRRIHDLESALQSRNLEFTPSDIRRMTEWLSGQRDLLYQKPQTGPQKNGIDLFNPGPSLPHGSPD